MQIKKRVIAHHLTADKIAQRKIVLGVAAMNLKEIKTGFGDCDWMRAFLNGHTVDAILWLIGRVEELEIKETQRNKASKHSYINPFIGDK